MEKSQQSATPMSRAIGAEHKGLSCIKLRKVKGEEQNEQEQNCQIGGAVSGTRRSRGGSLRAFRTL